MEPRRRLCTFFRCCTYYPYPSVVVSPTHSRRPTFIFTSIPPVCLGNLRDPFRAMLTSISQVLSFFTSSSSFRPAPPWQAIADPETRTCSIPLPPVQTCEMGPRCASFLGFLRRWSRAFRPASPSQSHEPLSNPAHVLREDLAPDSGTRGNFRTPTGLGESIILLAVQDLTYGTEAFGPK